MIKTFLPLVWFPFLHILCQNNASDLVLLKPGASIRLFVVSSWMVLSADYQNTL